MPFADRAQAGRRLAEALRHLKGRDVVVLGLPRGGVPVAFEIAQSLGAPLDVIVVRKLGVPFQPELGMGAIGEDGVRVLNEEILQAAQVDEQELRAVEATERVELERRARRFRGGRRRVPLEGRLAVVVDDGIATGSTARAACRVARAHGASRVVLAVPVAPEHSVNGLASDADEVVCLETPSTFFAIGQFYSDFSQTSDQEVVDCLTRAGQGPEDGPGPARGRLPARDAEVEVDAGGLRLAGHLTVPEGAGGIVVFAHGSGSSRHSPRNRYVASVLTAAGLGTLLFDLLTPREELDRGNVFDIALLARRLADATRWLRGEPEGAARIGYFGASTGAAAALWAAADAGDEVGAVVSRGGRPDLAGARLADVRAPTLLVVGGDDRAVLELNQKARTLLRCESRLEVVPGATHLFEEPGTLTTAADLARDWFATHLG
jgi:putative phosphoribosyl transferase